MQPAVGGDEAVERVVAGDGIGVRLALTLGRELECVRGEVLPLLLGALLRLDLAQLSRVVSGHPASARQCLVHLPIPGKERQQVKGTRTVVVQVPLQRRIARQQLDRHLLGGLGFAEVELGDRALRLGGVQDRSGDGEDDGKGGQQCSHAPVIGHTSAKGQ